ncbi:MAG: hypothetical protein ACK4TA_15250 [Saprospiraceae bacterium]
MKAVAIKGMIDQHGVLTLEAPLRYRNQEVQVIILIPEEELLDDAQWLKGINTNPAFDFLQDEAEDIYTLEDGKPF